MTQEKTEFTEQELNAIWSLVVEKLDDGQVELANVWLPDLFLKIESMQEAAQ